ncbi:MAG: sodium:proton antiporter [Candidatus Krumholzibacteriia bacterium]
MTPRAVRIFVHSCLGSVLLAPAAWASGSGVEGGHLGESLPLWSILPFVGILLSIAIFPLVRPHFWHHHYPKVAAFWALILAVPFVIAHRGEAMHAILHTYLLEYFPFIILLWSLFTVAGGIVVRGTISGTPRANLVLLGIGTLIASWVGTTGASILLVHPLLRALANRRYKAHTVIFFIFLVSNIGGALTPLGDPPLFLGFLNGVPFFWTLHLIPHMLLLAAVLLAVYYVMDRHYYRREGQHHPPTRGPAEPIHLAGLRNLPLLLGIVAAVLLSGVLHLHDVRVLGIDIPWHNLMRDAALVVIGLVSLRITPHELRAANQFTWEPIREVAYLFAGIFMTIVPALAILNAGERGQLAFLIRAVEAPLEYFWITGSLSAFLDNAPTYLTFLNTALGKFYAGTETHQAVHMLIEEHARVLTAISAGAVFLGAMTYIGNAPNFMVRSIAEERGVAMPSFFGYLARWSLPILVPCLALVTYVFFR